MNKKSPVTAVLVDDQPDSLRYADHLSNSGLPCHKLQPLKQSQDLVSSIRQSSFDVVLLDYRLDDSNQVAYRGGTVAAQLKEALPNLPVVLLTSEAKLKQWLEHNPQIFGLFDLKLLKEELRQPDQWRLQATRIKDLALGYREIAHQTEKLSTGTEAAAWSVLATLLGATPEEEKLLPRYCQGPAPTRTTEIAGWLGELRSFPALLLDDAHVRVLFGLTEKSFQELAVQKLLQKARYTGVFSELERRWWRSRASQLLREITGEKILGSAEERVAELAKKIKKSLKADRCVVCEGGDIGQVCRLCGLAVDTSHVVRAVVDARPAWAEPPVICFKCIRTGRAEHVRFASGSEGLIEELRSGGAEER